MCNRQTEKSTWLFTVIIISPPLNYRTASRKPRRFLQIYRCKGPLLAAGSEDIGQRYPETWKCERMIDLSLQTKEDDVPIEKKG